MTEFGWWLLFPAAMLLAAGWMIRSHRQAWSNTKREADTLSEDEFEYRRGKYRRRMQSSVMLAVIALGVAIGPFLPLEGWRFSGYWSCVLLAVFWVVLMAVADMVATRLHFGRIRRRQLIEQAKLGAELRRLRHGKES